MNMQYMMLAAILVDNHQRDQEEYSENPLSTKEMAMVRQPRTSKPVAQRVLSLVAALRNRLPQREDELAEQTRIGKKRQASMS